MTEVQSEQELQNDIQNNTMDNTMKIYRAVIENNQSPEKDGRVQIRIYGIHTKKLDAEPTEHLAWAEVMQSTAFGFNTGIGFSSIPNIGTWVFCILDHNNPNMPIVLGAISGKPKNAADPSKGFNSPDGIFPLQDRLNEQDQNRLQRVQNLDKTIHKAINDNIDTVTATDTDSGADVSMTEPNSLSNLSKYPDNAVLETKSGHIIEIDDTPGNEKIRVYHKSGTYIDYRPDGSIVEKVQKNINKVIQGYVHTHIEKSVKNYINENIDEIIQGYVKRNIQQNLTEHINGNLTWKIGGNIDITSGGTQTNVNGGTYTHIAPRIDLNP